MSEITGKLGLNGAITLLFSVFILTGLNMTQVYGQPLDSPLYNHTNTKVVELMNAPAQANVAADVTRPAQATQNPLYCPETGVMASCQCRASVPVMFSAGELVYILALTGGACWAIIRKKRS